MRGRQVSKREPTRDLKVGLIPHWYIQFNTDNESGRLEKGGSIPMFMDSQAC